MEPRTKHFLMGFAAGVTTVVVLPIIAPVLTESGRPIAKALLKRSLLAFEVMRSQALRAAEAIEDLVAEVRAEVDTELAARAVRGVERAERRESPAAGSAVGSDVAAAGARWYAAATAGLKSKMVS
jgi:hypothetical protein